MKDVEKERTCKFHAVINYIKSGFRTCKIYSDKIFLKFFMFALCKKKGQLIKDENVLQDHKPWTPPSINSYPFLLNIYFLYMHQTSNNYFQVIFINITKQ